MSINVVYNVFILLVIKVHPNTTPHHTPHPTTTPTTPTPQTYKANSKNQTQLFIVQF
jgi:hypothetical protein